MSDLLRKMPCGCFTEKGVLIVCKNCRVLLAHEAFAQEMFDKSYPEIVVRKDKIFDKLGEEFDKMYADYWRGRRDAVQSLRGQK